MSEYIEKSLPASDQTLIANEAIRDSSLSLRARGLHHYFLSQPDDWQLSFATLTDSSDKDGRTAIASALNELIEHGYVTKERIKDESGRFTGISYQVFEVAQPLSDRTNSNQEGRA